MAGLVPAIHVSLTTKKEDVDARDKPGHDELVGQRDFFGFIPAIAC
jgi:hypothetical protein